MALRIPPRAPEVADPPGAIIYTSGTTGRPKGVRRRPPTPEQAMAALKTIGTVFDLSGAILNPGTQSITTIIPGPLYHSAPNGYSNFAVRANATIILEPRFDPEDLLRLIESHKVTHIQMVPTMFVRLLKLPEAVRRRYDVSSLTFVVHAAAPCPPHVKRAMIEWWGPVINEYYGSTETGAVVFCSSQEWLAHPGTVGKALPDAGLRILRDDGSEAAPGKRAKSIAACGRRRISPIMATTPSARRPSAMGSFRWAISAISTRTGSYSCATGRTRW